MNLVETDEDGLHVVGIGTIAPNVDYALEGERHYVAVACGDDEQVCQGKAHDPSCGEGERLKAERVDTPRHEASHEPGSEREDHERKIGDAEKERQSYEKA